MWYSLPKSDRDYRLAKMFRCSKEAGNDEAAFKTNVFLLGQKVRRQAFMKINGIHVDALQNARKLALGA